MTGRLLTSLIETIPRVARPMKRNPGQRQFPQRLCLAAALSCAWAVSTHAQVDPLDFVTVTPITDNDPLTNEVARDRVAINSTPFKNESMITVGDSQFTTYYREDGKLLVARRDLTAPTNDWEIRVTEFTSFNINDSHNVPVISIDGDGYLHLAWGTHGNPLLYTALEHARHQWTVPEPHRRHRRQRRGDQHHDRLERNGHDLSQLHSHPRVRRPAVQLPHRWLGQRHVPYHAVQRRYRHVDMGRPDVDCQHRPFRADLQRLPAQHVVRFQRRAARELDLPVQQFLAYRPLGIPDESQHLLRLFTRRWGDVVQGPGGNDPVPRRHRRIRTRR